MAASDESDVAKPDESQKSGFDISSLLKPVAEMEARSSDIEFDQLTNFMNRRDP